MYVGMCVYVPLTMEVNILLEKLLERRMQSLCGGRALRTYVLGIINRNSAARLHSVGPQLFALNITALKLKPQAINQIHVVCLYMCILYVCTYAHRETFSPLCSCVPYVVRYWRSPFPLEPRQGPVRVFPPGI